MGNVCEIEITNQFQYIAPFAEIQCLFEVAGLLITDDTDTAVFDGEWWKNKHGGNLWNPYLQARGTRAGSVFAFLFVRFS